MYMKEYEYPWTSDGSGDATVETLNLNGSFLRAIEYIPATGGDAPATAYTVIIKPTGRGYDILDGDGADEPVADDVIRYATIDIQLPDRTLTITVSNAGDTKKGTVVLHTEYRGWID